MSNGQALPILIAGGGIGGLAAGRTARAAGRRAARGGRGESGASGILQSGEGIRGRGLIGCDGGWAKLRDKVVGAGKPGVAGRRAYRAGLTREEVPGDRWR